MSRRRFASRPTSRARGEARVRRRRRRSRRRGGRRRRRRGGRRARRRGRRRGRSRTTRTRREACRRRAHRPRETCGVGYVSHGGVRSRGDDAIGIVVAVFQDGEGTKRVRPNARRRSGGEDIRRGSRRGGPRRIERRGGGGGGGGGRRRRRGGFRRGRARGRADFVLADFVLAILILAVLVVSSRRRFGRVRSRVHRRLPRAGRVGVDGGRLGTRHRSVFIRRDCVPTRRAVFGRAHVRARRVARLRQTSLRARVFGRRRRRRWSDGAAANQTATRRGTSPRAVGGVYSRGARDSRGEGALEDVRRRPGGERASAHPTHRARHPRQRADALRPSSRARPEVSGRFRGGFRGGRFRG